MRRILIACIAACGGAKPAVLAAQNASVCAGLDDSACKRAKGLISAANAFSTMRTELILDPTSSFAHGRGLVRGADGLWTPIPTQCATPTAQKSAGVDASQVDFGFVGIAIDNTVLGADVEIAPYFSGGAEAGIHKVRLVAVAYVRDLDPQFFDASDEVAYAGEACTCRNATHFIGSVKMGGMLSYDVTVREGEAHGKALDFFKAHFSAKEATIVETRVGGLEVDVAHLDAGEEPLGLRFGLLALVGPADLVEVDKGAEARREQKEQERDARVHLTVTPPGGGAAWRPDRWASRLAPRCAPA